MISGNGESSRPHGAVHGELEGGDIPSSELRAVHRISLARLSHNYTEVESAASKQRCSVIVVVKADGYGHGSIQSALYLADNVGADAFAVATLEEGIALRKAFQDTPPGTQYNPSGGITSLFHPPSTTNNNVKADGPSSRRRYHRAPQIRILVLGAPVNYPRSFDDYLYYGIEVMISGPEVAKALLEWVYNTEDRKRLQVERAATEAKERALQLQSNVQQTKQGANGTPSLRKKPSDSDSSNNENSIDINIETPQIYRPPSATLSNVTGMDLAKEVRQILKNQKRVNTSTPHSSDTTSFTNSSMSTSSPIGKKPVKTQTFAGIEEAAKNSRSRHKAFSKVTRGEPDTADVQPKNPLSKSSLGIGRKRLRWHALVDSGMGRLGFRTDTVSSEENGQRRDTVEIIKELLEVEDSIDAPVDFFGMCTHMADASSSSYTGSQMERFKFLLKRVRAAGISIPTISSDNSAALLTTEHKHFDPKEILTQDFTDSRGYVRTGGAIFGQRPVFRQIQAISTLCASVRHVAILKKGESVGYDRAYIAPSDVRIATIAIGFADGYPRELGNGVGKVAIRGSLFPVAGNVCMDMLMVDLGPAQAADSPGATIVVGDTAILWGPAHDEDGDGLVRLQDLAAELNTTQSALTCGLNKDRVLRQYE